MNYETTLGQVINQLRNGQGMTTAQARELKEQGFEPALLKQQYTPKN